MNIPFYGIKRFYEKFSKQIIDNVDSVYSEGQLFGDEVVKLEKELCKQTGRKYAVTVNSCTDALFFALQSLDIKKGDEVLLTSFSFIASATPIIRTGATPVFVDIDPNTFLMDYDDLKMKISSRTKAIVGVHIFGQLLNIEELEKIAKENNLCLIEDAAQGFGASSANRIAGSMGNISCLSFDPTKIISAFGSGGALLTDDAELYRMAKKLRYHGKSENNEYEILGYNSRLSASQCAIINYQLKEHLSGRIDKLRQIASVYNQELGDIEGIIVPQSLAENFHIYHKYALQTKDRDKMLIHLKAKGIETMIHYSKPLYKNRIFSGFDNKTNNCKICEKICDNVISLPIYPELTDEEIKYVCESVKSF